jgi:hypothetical protein
MYPLKKAQDKLGGRALATAQQKYTLGLHFRQAVPPSLLRLRRLCQSAAFPSRRTPLPLWRRTGRGRAGRGRSGPESTSALPVRSPLTFLPASLLLLVSRVNLIPILLQGCRSRRRCCSITTPPGHLAYSPSCKSHPRLREHGRLNGHLRCEILQCHGSCSVVLSECRISSVTVWLSTATPV